jgi:hypothetical protein
MDQVTAKTPTDQYSEKEAAERRDAVIKRMIAMPPKPHSEMKMGKSPPQHRAKPRKATKKKT